MEEDGQNGSIYHEDRMVKNAVDGVCSFDSANGSREVRSCEDSESSTADHLLVMVHGILGGPDDWQFASKQFVRMFPDKIIVYCSKRNSSTLSLDGVDVMGERLTLEVLDVIHRKPNLRKISFLAHSIGGLVARYAIGKLFKSGKQISDEAATIAGLEPVNFITVATPHLGSQGNKQVPFLLGVPVFEKVASHCVHWIFKRTGRHLFLTDGEDGKPPLLKRMLQDQGDYHWMSALEAFQRRVAYANANYDHIVGWRTSSIRRNDELPKWEKFIDERYPHIVHEEHCKGTETKTETCDFSAAELEEELVKGLSRVSWYKVDVSFHTCKHRFAAHSVIQVKDQIIHMEGKDVVQHIIDHFLL